MCKRIVRYLMAVTILLLPSLSFTARACTCGIITPCQSYAGASSVFVGLVTKVEAVQSDGRPPPDAMSTTFTSASFVARFKIEESFLGVETKEMEVYGGGTTCDFYFKGGERYLVYAYRGGEDQKLYTSICTRTSLLSTAAGDLGYLRNAIRTSSGGTVIGSVTRVVYDAGKDEPIAEPLPKTKVIFESQGHKVESVTDEKGDFKLSGLPQGRYKTRTDPATNSSSAATDSVEPQKEWEVDVPNHGCVRVWFSSMPDGEIAGQVFDEAGLFDKEIELELIPADQKVTSSNLRSVMIDEEGRFRFTFLPPGRYLLGFNISGGPSLLDPHAESFYPGVGSRAKATILTVGIGQKITDLKLPVSLRVGERMVEGIAVWPDGRPAADVWIELQNSRTGYREGNGDKTDANGHFAIKAIEGQIYELSALIQIGTPLVNSKPIIIRAGREKKPIKLVIEPLKTPRKPKLE